LAVLGALSLKALLARAEAAGVPELELELAETKQELVARILEASPEDVAPVWRWEPEIHRVDPEFSS
jgi:hypothetical protein